MNFWDEVRVVFIFILIFCVILLLTAFYMEFQLGLEPCPMCIVQRIAVALAGLSALIGILHDVYKSGYRNFYLGLTAFFSLAGGISATRHLYLQSLPPDRVPSCGPDLNYLLDNNFISDALIQLFIGDGNCAEVMWSLLGITIPGWVLICTGLIFLLSIRGFFAEAARMRDIRAYSRTIFNNYSDMYSSDEMRDIAEESTSRKDT